MSLYNMVFGVNQMAGTFLATLRLSPRDVPRIRDVYLDFALSEPRIGVFTRTGGPNRNNEGEDVNEILIDHPLYLSDEDWSFDPTYATFFFRLPEEFSMLVEIYKQRVEDKRSPTERFKQLLDDMREGKTSPDTEHANVVGEALAKRIKTAMEGGGK